VEAVVCQNGQQQMGQQPTGQQIFGPVPSNLYDGMEMFGSLPQFANDLNNLLDAYIPNTWVI
jgi:hypothetical protein